MHETCLTITSKLYDISKALETATLCAVLVLIMTKSLQHLSSTFHLWQDSLVVLKWIVNPDFQLLRLVKRRVDKIHLINFTNDRNHVPTYLHFADVGTGEGRVNNSDSFGLWLSGPQFLV